MKGRAMTEEELRQEMASFFAVQGVATASEEGTTVLRWLTEDGAGANESRGPVLWRAANLGLTMYRSFQGIFAEFWLAEPPRGVRYVRKALRDYYGFDTPPMIEAVVDRIRDRRQHLLDGLREKVQPSLFAPQTFDPERVAGYFVCVARIESRHVPRADLPWQHMAGVDLQALPDGVDLRRGIWMGDRDDAYSDIKDLLIVYWGEHHDFGKRHRWEGQVAAGLGETVEIPEVQVRARLFRESQLPLWLAARDRLTDRVCAALGRRAVAENRLAWARTPQEQQSLVEQVDRAEAELANLRRRLDRHPLRLRPRPADIKAILAGFVRSLGTVRFQRIGREIEIKERRVMGGWDALVASIADALPATLGDLADAVSKHLARRPASPQAHGLSPLEKRQRQRGISSWRAEGATLLARIREERQALSRLPLPSDFASAVVAWLDDAEDLYEFGVLTRKGILAALGSRSLRRLRHLLRHN